MKPVSIIQTSVLCIGTLALLTGCTFAKAKLTGTPGASYQGYVQMTSGYPETNSAKLPDSWSTASLTVGFLNRLEKCEYRKANTNDSLVLNLHTHGFKGTIEAPPGTEGLRVTREGKKYKAEVF